MGGWAGVIRSGEVARTGLRVTPGPNRAWHQVVDLDVEDLGETLHVVEVEADLAPNAPGDVHRRPTDLRSQVGAGHHPARHQRADLFGHPLAEQVLHSDPICHGSNSLTLCVI